MLNIVAGRTVTKLTSIVRNGFSRSFKKSLSSQQEQQQRQNMDHAIHMVRSYDPSGYLPGQILPTQKMKDTYYATRSFWVETGLRFGTTAKVPLNSSPSEHLEWWQQGIDHVFEEESNSYSDDEYPLDFAHPTLQLLKKVVRENKLSKIHLDNILAGRQKDLDIKQYATLQDLVDHAQISCGSLMELVLEAGGNAVTKENDPTAWRAARYVGVCHGLTNALRLSIPVVSTTGKLIVPQELCEKYGVKSPRYLLSALGLGDAECKRALQLAVKDIADEALLNLEKARELRPEIVSSKHVFPVLLPGLVSETFLKRLEESGYDLTDRNLRNVGMLEHWLCGARMIGAHFQSKY